MNLKKLSPKGKHILILATASAVFIFTAATSLYTSYAAKQRTYTGIEECARCHNNDGIGNQYVKWLATPHARSIRALKSYEGKEIAEKLGIQQPWNDKTCLRCHTTGGGNDPKTADENVGCEACHGPGSDYYPLEKHASLSDRESGYRIALANGMYPIIGIDHIKNREKLCLRCHTENRPCLPTDPEKRKNQKLSLEMIANFIFKHPVRR